MIRLDWLACLEMRQSLVTPVIACHAPRQAIVEIIFRLEQCMGTPQGIGLMFLQPAQAGRWIGGVAGQVHAQPGGPGVGWNLRFECICLLRGAAILPDDGWAYRVSGCIQKDEAGRMTAAG